MKVWLGSIGRACIEFPILLALIALIGGTESSLSNPSISIASFALNFGHSARELMPLAAVLTLFLSFFSFDLAVQGRAFGYLGLALVGILTLAGGIGLHRIPLSSSVEPIPKAGAPIDLPPAGIAYKIEDVGIWYRSIDGDEVLDAIAIDFRISYPRLSYASRASYDSAMGTIKIDSREFLVASRSFQKSALVPEASVFEGSWIWERLARLDQASWAAVAAIAGGFLLLALGFRFLSRLTTWPLANALLAVSGLIALLAGDAALDGMAARTIADTLGSLGLTLEPSIAVAAVEGVAGLLLIGLDLLLAPRTDRRIDG